MSATSTIDRIVVGVDGSESSAAALRFALDEARAHGAGVEVVAAWSFPPTMAAEWTGGEIEGVAEGLERSAQRILAEAVAELGSAAEGVEIEAVVRQGPPAEVLLSEAESADLLVVGSRGRGGFKGLVLGSVSQQAAYHATCPITIVKA